MIEPRRKPDMASVFDALPGNYALLTPSADFSVVAASDSLLRLMGTTRPAALGRPVFSLFAADAANAPATGAHTMRRSLEDVLQSRQVDCLPTLRFDLPGADGQREEHFWAFCNTPVVDETGALTGILLHAENVTRLQRAEEARKADEALNRQILNSARDFAIIGTGLDGRITCWNEGACRVLGARESDMLGRTFDCFFTPEDLAQGRPATEMRRSLQNGHASDERWHVRRDGRRFWASGQLTPLKSPAGEAIGFVKMLRDQTEQHLTAQALRESRHRLDSALDTGLIGFFEWDVVEGQVFGDERFAAMHDVAPAPAGEGLPLTGLIARVHPDDRQSLRRCLATALAAHADYTREFRVLRKDGNVSWVLLRARCYLQQGDKPLRYTGAAIDVSASKLAEAQVRKLNARLGALVRERTSALRMREAQMRAC